MYQINFNDEIIITEYHKTISKLYCCPSVNEVNEAVASLVITTSETGAPLLGNNSGYQSTI